MALETRRHFFAESSARRKRRALQKIFSLLDKLEFDDVSSILKQAKDKQPSLKGKVPDRADGWSVSDQKVL